MLKNYSDYTYQYIDDSTIQFTRTEGDTTESGVIIQGQERTRMNGEAQEVYEPWDELMLTGLTIEPATAPTPPSYREVRAYRYANELSPEGSQATAIGDCLDALISAVADGDLTKLSEIKSKIDLIKQEVPKDEQ